MLALIRGPAFITALIVGAFLLGYWGYRSIPEFDLSPTDAAYRSLQLFVTDAQFPAQGSPWQLEIARFLAPIAITYAVLATLFALAREEIQRIRTRWFTRGHILVIGLGSRGGRLARSLSRELRVAAIEMDAANGTAKSLRADGVAVLIGDGRDESVLEAAGLDRAAHVVVLTADDSVNLQIAAALTESSAGTRRPYCHVAVEDPVLWSKLHRLPLQRGLAGARIEFLSVPDREARALVEAAAAGCEGSHAILIKGEGAVAARVIVHALRTFQEVRRIQLDCVEPEAVISMLEHGDPWVFADDVLGTEEHDGFTFDLAIVCGMPDASSVTAAVEIIDANQSGGSVYLAVDDARIGSALQVAAVEMSQIELVPTKSAVFGRSLFERSAIDVLARAKHADYLTQQTARGETVESNRSLVGWDALPRSLQESNRRYAEGVADKLGKLDAELVPLTGRDPDAHLDLPNQTLESLARGEHERWVRDQKADGWRYTDGVKDPEDKLHPMLVDWDELSELEREKDRDGVRDLPRMLAPVGYSVSLRDEGGTR